MLKIRSEQVAALDRAAERGFVVATAAWLRRSFPSETGAQSDAELCAFVDGCFVAAAAFGFLFEADLRRYAAIAVALGRDPGSGPEADILAREEISAARRLAQLEAIVAASPRGPKEEERRW
jgi:hypothetical protein